MTTPVKFAAMDSYDSDGTFKPSELKKEEQDRLCQMLIKLNEIICVLRRQGLEDFTGCSVKVVDSIKVSLKELKELKDALDELTVVLGYEASELYRILDSLASEKFTYGTTFVEYPLPQIGNSAMTGMMTISQVINTQLNAKGLEFRARRKAVLAEIREKGFEPVIIRSGLPSL
jgi:hypothetical protein